ncbi:MAG: DUF5667 domain-containing protein [Candidatus Parcubacteria bacterium]|nr:DUF5667 domain-containing protein [Candidatus Parcubacteria bacterium]
MKKINIIHIILTVCLIYFVFTPKVLAVEYSLAWPGILPDNKLYKLKVLRNKIIERMIVDPVKKIEFDLLMADKTIYASKLLVDKGKIALARETVLKGENYYSILVQDYNTALLRGRRMPASLDQKITLAAKKHQEIFEEVKNKLEGEDKKTFEAAENFSHINYDFIQGLRTPKNK